MAKYNLTCYDKKNDLIELEAKTICVELPVSKDGDAVIIEITCESVGTITVKNMCANEDVKIKTNIELA